MKLHPHMVTAIYLRYHPQDVIVDKDGKETWYSPTDDKYYFRNPNASKLKGIYEARGLTRWWKMYLRECENWEFDESEDLPF